MIPELLSPAGSYEGLKAAFSAGADAVYLGGGLFGARAYARNFSEEELISSINEAHVLGKKLYLTVNTLVKDSEFERLYKYLLPYYEAGLDAVIVQDPGVLRFIKEHFPSLNIHASTQMTVTGLYGAEFLKRSGVKRIIPARELSLEEIKRIYEGCGIEIECFVHGALCYCYSGQCLLSSIIGGRSGNRGRCAQPCRQPYIVSSPDKNVRAGKSYALSLKDLCAIDLLPELISAGVCSFKIEGRMKRPEYTAGVTSVYRKYLDSAVSGNEYIVSESDRKMLFEIFNREGFNRGYFEKHNGPDMMALKTDNSDKARLSKEKEELFKKIRDTYESSPAKAEAHLTAYAGSNGVSLEICSRNYCGYAYSDEVFKADNAPLDEASFTKRIGKLGDTLFYPSAVSASVEEGLFVRAGTLNELRRQAVKDLTGNILGKYKRHDAAAFKKRVINQDFIHKEPFVSASVRTMEQFEEVLKQDLFHRIYIPYYFFEELSAYVRYESFSINTDKEIFIKLPYVSGMHETDIYHNRLGSFAEKGYGFLCSSMEDAALIKSLDLQDRTILDQGVYAFNDHASDFYHEIGFSGDTVPYELNRNEIARRDNSRSEMLIYGRIPVMISAQCVRKNYSGCDKRFGHMSVKDDHGFEFPVECDCSSCRNIIYNSVPLSLLSVKDLPYAGSYRMSFTVEDKTQIREAVSAFREKRDVGGSFTRGHYNRGVE